MAIPESIRILSVGNSFSVDTMKHVADIALSLGVKSVLLGNLYIGGCSIKRHFSNAEADAPAYRYYENDGTGWTEAPDKRISETIKKADWDIISIQHGTGDGSRYTSPESYADLPRLVAYIRSLAPAHKRIAFNMTWVGESYHHHHEIVSYGGDQLLIYEKIASLTETLVQSTEGIDVVIPTGTAIQNAHTTALAEVMSRDGYHLSHGIGRYIAGLTFFSRLTGTDIRSIEWMPEDVDADAREIALRALHAALKTPFAVTALS